MRDTTVILANGDFPTHPTPLSYLQTAQRVVCCDGAANDYVRMGNLPDIVIGDGDSLDKETREKLAGRIINVSEQEDNDLTKAFRYVMSQWPETNVVILGATGKREDHMLGNIFHLADFCEDCRDIRMVTDFGIFIPCEGDAVFPSHLGQQVSIFNISCRTLSSEGLKWPISPFRKLWEGTLNESLYQEFSIQADGKYIVYQAF